MLEKFRAAKAAEIERLLALDKADNLPEPFAGERPDFIRALWEAGPGAVIAEYKRASPSQGDIALAVTPEQAAAAYRDAGAAALSVLTEEAYFKGHLDYLERMKAAGLPLLRKDFLLHPLQVVATAATPASAVLLIARMLEEDELDEMIDLAQILGLTAVVEVFDEDDLAKALACEPEIIQVNNRDLQTLQTNLDVSLTLIDEKDEDQLWISASGIKTPEDAARLVDAGFDALLVGTSLMAGGDPGAALRALRGK